jgi:chromosome segregation ATPase
MEDPRIEELLEHLDETDADGRPTRMAQFAQKVQTYLDEITELRKELDAASRDVVDMESRVASMESQIKDKESLQADLLYEAQDAAVRAAMAGTAGGAAAMLKMVEEKRQRLADFEAHYSGEKTRLERLKVSVATKRSVIRKNRDLIALRINTITNLLDRASQLEPELGAAPGAEPVHAQTGHPQSGMVVRPRRVRRIRIIRRH